MTGPLRARRAWATCGETLSRNFKDPLVTCRLKSGYVRVHSVWIFRHDVYFCSDRRPLQRRKKTKETFYKNEKRQKKPSRRSIGTEVYNYLLWIILRVKSTFDRFVYSQKWSSLPDMWHICLIEYLIQLAWFHFPLSIRNRWTDNTNISSSACSRSNTFAFAGSQFYRTILIYLPS